MPIIVIVQDIDLGWSATMRNLSGLDSMRVGAGLFDEEQAAKGAWHEFGTASIPARPWLSVAADTSMGATANLAAQVIGQVADRKSTPAQALATIGKFMVSAARGVIEGQRVEGPPLAASTAAAKGSTDKLIDTGAMLNAIDYEISKDGVTDE